MEKIAPKTKYNPLYPMITNTIPFDFSPSVTTPFRTQMLGNGFKTVYLYSGTVKIHGIYTDLKMHSVDVCYSLSQ